MIALTRPLTAFDLETTGPDPQTARIVEIAIVQLKPDGASTEWSSRINPGIPIPPEATAIHGIADADVADKPTFAQMAPRILKAFVDVDYLGFNIARFDVPVLKAEFARAGVDTRVPEGVQPPRILDVYCLWTKISTRKLADAVQQFCGRPHLDAHGALSDVRGTIDVFQAMSLNMEECWSSLPWDDLQKLHDILFPKNPNALDEAGKFVWDPVRGTAVLAFSKHKGTPLSHVDRGFLSWMLKPEQNFPDDTKAIVRNALYGIFPSGPRVSVEA